MTRAARATGRGRSRGWLRSGLVFGVRFGRMTSVFFAVLVLGALAALYVPVMRTLALRRRYGPTERRYIRAADARLDRDPGDLGAALALCSLYRTHADHVRLRALYHHTRGHLEGRPEYEPLRRAA